MMVRNLTLALLFTIACVSVQAQDAMTTRSFTPADQWELGVDLGTPMIVGDIDAKFPGFGGGLHVRKAFDHVFSFRLGALYASMKNEGDDIRSSETSWISGSGQIVMTVNNLRFNKPHRKVNVNVFGGLGFQNYTTTAKNVKIADGTTPNETEFTGTYPTYEVGAGLAFRVSPKFNIGLEYTFAQMFGSEGDLLDGDQNVDGNVTSYRDVFHWPHVSLNFNLGGKDKMGNAKSEPLYWANPLATAGDAITELEARPIYDPTDTDGDGIIDSIDEEDNSPAGARVDTKGVTADSDGDKVPDYKDKEPYSPPGYTVDADGVAQVPKPITEADVNRIVDAKIAAIKFPEPQTNEWFFPSVNFSDNSYKVRYSEYEKLYQVATVLKNNPNLKVVAVGNTDARGSEGYNNVLSYNRSKAAIDALVEQYGVSRDRVILNWAGESNKLIPVNGSNASNRRVEFRVAKGETEMARPEGSDAGTGSFKGNKDAGY
ncbi:MAG: OmpA family protein [Lewinellaceae bacterium]|nr:OmpA family protein [Saprospiraceae bacterium]MCB9342738.1 OmpA family protein [Lewinellaceae bacterium]